MADHAERLQRNVDELSAAKTDLQVEDRRQERPPERRLTALEETPCRIR
ncbi:hypothetical protein ACFVOB_28305 [Streptomyces rochei]